MKLNPVTLGPMRSQDLLVALAMAEVLATLAVERCQRVVIRCKRKVQP